MAGFHSAGHKCEMQAIVVFENCLAVTLDKSVNCL